MDRAITYTGAVPLGDDFLRTQIYGMKALGMALKAVLGTTTIVDGLSCTPTGPASMQVLVTPGSIYSLVNVDGTAFGDIAADTTHQIVKQGLSLDNAALSCPAPVTTGQSINYLIQVEYQDVDTDSVVLPYFNASNPPVAFAGPANTGTSQNTTRKGNCVISVKAGASATTGTQTTPAPDAGFMGLWYVTVPNGATSITSGNIHLYTGTGAATGSTAFWSTPFIAEKLNDKVSIATGDLRWQPLGGGGGARTILTNASTYHVSTTGNDTTGTGSSGAPWATIQKAVNVLASNVDLAGFTATIQLADGTYAGASMTVPWVGGSVENVILNGNSGTPSNTIISSSGFCLNAQGAGTGLTVTNIKLTTSGTDTACLGAEGQGSMVVGTGINFGAATSGYHIYATTDGNISLPGNYTISGGAMYHLWAEVGAMVNYAGSPQTVTLTGTPAFSGAFALASTIAAISMNFADITFSGSATGTYYNVQANGVISTLGGGATFLPGSSAGSTATGGQYI